MISFIFAPMRSSLWSLLPVAFNFFVLMSLVQFAYSSIFKFLPLVRNFLDFGSSKDEDFSLFIFALVLVSLSHSIFFFLHNGVYFFLGVGVGGKGCLCFY